MSFEGVTKDIKDEREPYGEKRNGGLKWVEGNIGYIKMKLSQKWQFTNYLWYTVLAET